MDNTNLNQNPAQQPAPGAVSAAGVVPPYAAVPRPAYAPKLKWPPIAGNAFDAVFMMIALVFSVFAVHSVFFAGFFKIGFSIAYALWFVLESVYIFTKNKPKLTVYPLLMGALSLGAGGVFALFNDELINFALLLFIAFANAMYFMLLSKQEHFCAGDITSLADVFRYVVMIPFEFITEPFRSAFSANTGEKKKGSAKNTVQVLIGLAVALPIAAILIALLSSADAAFKGLVGKIFSNLLLSLCKLILGIILFPLLLSPAFALRYKMPNREYKAAKKRDLKRFPSVISITGLAVIVLVYIGYLVAQLAYFFDAFKGILPADYSASEYARRGFFEMCVVCAINVLIIAFSMAFSKENSKASAVIHKLFQIFIALVSLVIGASSFSKMYLYIQLYGFTRKRILTSVFILMLAIVFLALMVRILVKKFPYMKVIAVCCFAILIALGYWDIDSHIAQYNMYLYRTSPSIAAHLEKDGGFVDELGDSATPYIAAFAKEAKGDVQKCAQSWLCQKWGEENVDDYYSVKLSKCVTPLSYNRARRAATNILDEWNQTYDYKQYHERICEYDYGQAVKPLPDYCYEKSYYDMFVDGFIDEE